MRFATANRDMGITSVPGRESPDGNPVCMPNPRRQQTYDPILHAIRKLADTPGLICRATNGEIGLAAGLYHSTVREHILGMELTGTIATFGKGRRRTIVLLDHSESDQAVAALEQAGCKPGDYTCVAR